MIDKSQYKALQDAAQRSRTNFEAARATLEGELAQLIERVESDRARIHEIRSILRDTAEAPPPSVQNLLDTIVSIRGRKSDVSIVLFILGVLAAAERQGDTVTSARIAEVAEAAGLNFRRGAVHTAIHRMQAKGLLSKTDKRGAPILLTEAGWSMVREHVLVQFEITKEPSKTMDK